MVMSTTGGFFTYHPYSECLVTLHDIRLVEYSHKRQATVVVWDSRERYDGKWELLKPKMERKGTGFSKR